jgi:adenine-specific DNA methylase
MAKPPAAYPKRLIEVDLPIKEISAHARREKHIRHGHISTLHIWWARRPLAACRAVICASLWPDPADESCPQAFREAAAKILCEFAERVRTDKELAILCKAHWNRWNRTVAESLDPVEPLVWMEMGYALLDFIEDFANWGASNEPGFLNAARKLITASHRALGGANGTRPVVMDPFAGGGTIPLEALRLGADTFASDINPVAVLLNKTTLELIPSHGEQLVEEVQRWGKWSKAQVEASLGDLYPNEADGSTPIAYLWSRTIKCEGPGCGAEVPLVRSLWLAKKDKRSVALRPVADAKKKRIDFEIVEGIKSKDVGLGTITRGSATCPLCGYTTSVDRVRAQFRARRGGTLDARMYCCVVRTKDGRTEYRAPSRSSLNAASKSAMRVAALEARGIPLPRHPLPPDGALGFRVQKYGIAEWKDLFIPRQQAMLLTYAEVVARASAQVDEDLRAAVHTLLALTVSKMADFSSSLCIWRNVRTCAAHTFGRQTLSMVWDFAEMSPFAGSAGDFGEGLAYLEEFVSHIIDAARVTGTVQEADAAENPLADDLADMLFTDPPYYDAIPYSHLSEYFAFWLEACGALRTDAKSTQSRRERECIVDEALGKTRRFFEEKMTRALAEGRRVAKPDAIGIIVFAHKSTVGWETQLQGNARCWLDCHGIMASGYRALGKAARTELRRPRILHPSRLSSP